MNRSPRWIALLPLSLVAAAIPACADDAGGGDDAAHLVTSADTLPDGGGTTAADAPWAFEAIARGLGKTTLGDRLPMPVGIAPLPGGDVVLTGFAYGTLKTTTYNPALRTGSSDSFFIVRVTKSGALAWGRAGAVGEEHIEHTAIDAEGNVYAVAKVAGEYGRGYYSENGHTFTAGAGACVRVLLKYRASDGVLAWGHRLGQMTSDCEWTRRDTAVVVAMPGGGVSLLASYGGNVRLLVDTTNRAADIQGRKDAFGGYVRIVVASQFASDGTWQKNTEIKGSFGFSRATWGGWRAPRLLAADAAGSLVLVGDTEHAPREIIVEKIAADGTIVFDRRFGSDAYDKRVEGLAVDATGRLALVGRFSSAIDFGGGELVANTFFDGFAALLDADGKHVTSTALSATNVSPKAVAFDARGDLLVTGSFTGLLAPGTRSVGPRGDVFVARVSPTSAPTFRSFGDSATQEGRAIAVDAAGTVFVAGSNDGVIAVGSRRVGAAWGSPGMRDWSDFFAVALP